MQQVKKGDTVSVHYSGRLTTGEPFDSSEGRDPLVFTVGAGQMIPGFDAAIPGMQVGEKKTIQISAEQGYGERDVNAVIEFPLTGVPADMKLEIGMQLMLSNAEGMPLQVVVTELRQDTVILDANHFLAGKDLEFDIELVSIG